MVFVIIMIAKALGGGGVPSYANLVKRGVPARGILLAVAPRPNSTIGTAPWRYQLRDVVMDIEIPGRPPYQANVTPFIPTNLARDVLPGATVELRVDPQRPLMVAIVGPGVGFNAALLNAGSQGMR